MKQSSVQELTLENLPQIGQQIRGRLQKGDIVILSGKLGAGKTTLIKHILPEYEINSPSFLHALFYGDDFAHIDAYTFKSREAFLNLDLPDILSSRCVIIEWGDLFKDILEQFDARIIKIAIEHSFEANLRTITIEL
jgi:tRNA threonylcarbamoyladenosine biosynthesis protein TsaE